MLLILMSCGFSLSLKAPDLAVLASELDDMTVLRSISSQEYWPRVGCTGIRMRTRDRSRADCSHTIYVYIRRPI